MQCGPPIFGSVGDAKVRSPYQPDRVNDSENARLATRHPPTLPKCSS